MSSIVFHISLNKKTKITTKKTLRKTGLEDQENIRNELLNSDVTICEICCSLNIQVAVVEREQNCPEIDAVQ